MSTLTTPDVLNTSETIDDTDVTEEVHCLLAKVRDVVLRSRSGPSLSTDRLIEVLYKIGNSRQCKSELMNEDRTIADLLKESVSLHCDTVVDSAAGECTPEQVASPEFAITCANDVFSSPSYKEMQTSMLARISHASLHAVDSIESGATPSPFWKTPYVPRAGISRNIDLHTPFSEMSGIISGRRSNDPFDLDASFSGMGGFLPAGKELEDIFESLAVHQDTATRLDGLHKISKYDTQDLMGSSFWDELEQQLCLMLSDEDPILADKTLQFVYRMFHGRNGVTREVYTLLVEHIHSYVSRIGGLHQHSLGPIVRQMQALNEFQFELPKYWTRYGERSMAPIVAASLRLLDLTSPVAATHLVALFQPSAKWFKEWMKGRFCRQKMLEFFQDNKYIFSRLVTNLMIDLQFFCTKSCTDPPRWARLARLRDVCGLSCRQVAYLHLIYLVSIVATVLRYRQACMWLFPLTLEAGIVPGDLLYEEHPHVKFTSTQCHITPHGVVANLVQAMCTFPNTSGRSHGSDRFNLVTVIAEVIRVFPENPASRLLFDVGIIQQLLQPLRDSISTDKTAQIPTALLLTVADLLARIASAPEGRAILVSRQNEGDSSAADVIALFTSNRVRGVAGSARTDDIELATSFLLVCRLLYRTHTGFAVLARHKIDQVLVDALAVPSDLPGWVYTIVDSLLNLASTPKGMLELQNTGISCVRRCAEVLFERFSKKLQVSKYEKFGYGVMVMQFAATEIGMQVLCETGLIACFVKNVFTALENFSDVRPKDEPARTGLSTQLHMEATSSVQYGLDTLLSRLVLVDSVKPMFEQDHLTGVKIVSVFVSCLDSLCLVESRYGLSNAILTLQETIRIDDEDHSRDQFIIDPLSLARNRLLVITQVIGGPTEKLLPPASLDNHNLPYAFALFSEKPVPTGYWIEQTISNSITNSTFEVASSEIEGDLQTLEFGDFAGATKSLVVALERCRKAGKVNRTQIGLAFGKIILKSSMHTMHAPAENLDFLKFQEVEPIELSKPMQFGLDLAVRYINNLGLPGSATIVFELKDVICRTTAAFANERHEPARFLGFDWFSATIYSIFLSPQTTLEFLERFVTSPHCPFMWHTRLAGSKNLPKNGTHPLYHSMAHIIEDVVQKELPAIASAFRLSGYTISQISMTWLRQCFWNFLDWDEIVQYIAMCISHGSSMQVYYCVAVLRHLQATIIELTQAESLVENITTMQIQGFRCGEALDYLGDLEERYPLDDLKHY